MIATAEATVRCAYSIQVWIDTPGMTFPRQNGQPCSPLPPDPQPSPESDTRTTPPSTISANVAATVLRASRR